MKPGTTTLSDLVIKLSHLGFRDLLRFSEILLEWDCPLSITKVTRAPAVLRMNSIQNSFFSSLATIHEGILHYKVRFIVRFTDAKQWECLR